MMRSVRANSEYDEAGCNNNPQPRRYSVPESSATGKVHPQGKGEGNEIVPSVVAGEEVFADEDADVPENRVPLIADFLNLIFWFLLTYGYIYSNS